ncbi:CBS domain-containing protein [Gottfriedia acidiceleris]|uniref:CBS domain-containing protein n=1 Tax=Gottfriedia acidiceleris TaxID=371036 RepID=A0ABY4JN57_9BACI|nr:CBS domain-containing protein [Gottfriedia acidiceleris]UPM54308.1 CBS domain-containing protein [Gottfriedia acidiceleris]
MRVKDVMSSNVECCSNQDSLQSVASKMETLNVGAIPVVDNGQVVGMITDRDLALRGISQGGNANASQVMSNNIVTIDCNASLQEASNLMAQHQIRRLPVVENGNLVGILSLGDLAVQEQSDESAGEALSQISQNDIQ